MKAILLPIKREYVNLIFNGEKKFEFRKRLCKEDISKIVIYETAPTKLVVGEVQVEEKLILPKNELWNLARCHAGVEKQFYDQYFEKELIGCLSVNFSCCIMSSEERFPPNSSGFMPEILPSNDCIVRYGT